MRKSVRAAVVPFIRERLEAGDTVCVRRRADAVGGAKRVEACVVYHTHFERDETPCFAVAFDGDGKARGVDLHGNVHQWTREEMW